MIDDQGQQLGIMPPFEALKMAREKNLDLVEISATAQPPVCRIMDYGKFLYEQEKKERAAKKASSNSGRVRKAIRCTPFWPPRSEFLVPGFSFRVC